MIDGRYANFVQRLKKLDGDASDDLWLYVQFLAGVPFFPGRGFGTLVSFQVF